MTAMRYLIAALLLLATSQPLVAAETSASGPTTKTLVWPDGTRYVGGVVNDQRSGKGTIFWQDGTRFVGEFKNDMRNGPGTMIMPDGTVYSGIFEDDQLVRATEAPANIAETSVTTAQADNLQSTAGTGGDSVTTATDEPVMTLPPQEAGQNTATMTPDALPTEAPRDTVAVAPVSTSKDTTTVTTIATTMSVDIEQQLRNSIGQWRDAWSSQDVSGYFASYSTEFEVPRSLSRRVWEALRRSRLTRPGRIQLDIEFERFTLVKPNVADVQFRQTYRSDVYGDVTEKRLRLKNEPGGWKIIQEKSL